MNPPDELFTTVALRFDQDGEPDFSGTLCATSRECERELAQARRENPDSWIGLCRLSRRSPS